MCYNIKAENITKIAPIRSLTPHPNSTLLSVSSKFVRDETE